MTAEAGSESAAEPPILFWKREARRLTEEDLSRLEVRAVAADLTKETVAAIRNLGAHPLSEEAVKRFESLQGSPVKSLDDLSFYLGLAPVFYIDREVSGDGRVTAGMFSVPDAKYSRWRELQALTSSDVDRIERGAHRATLVILAGGALTLLLLRCRGCCLCTGCICSSPCRSSCLPLTGTGSTSARANNANSTGDATKPLTVRLMLS